MEILTKQIAMSLINESGYWNVYITLKFKGRDTKRWAIATSWFMQFTR